MKTAVASFDSWHKTTVGYAVMGFVELVITYIIGSRAIDTGSWWEYLATLVFLVGGIQNTVQLIRMLGRRK